MSGRPLGQLLSPITNNLPAGRGRGGLNARALFAIRAVTLEGVTTGFAKCAGAVHVAGLAVAGNSGEVGTTAFYAGGVLAHLRPQAQQAQQEQQLTCRSSLRQLSS